MYFYEHLLFASMSSTKPHKPTEEESEDPNSYLAENFYTEFKIYYKIAP